MLSVKKYRDSPYDPASLAIAALYDIPITRVMDSQETDPVLRRPYGAFVRSFRAYVASHWGRDVESRVSPGFVVQAQPVGGHPKGSPAQRHSGPLLVGLSGRKQSGKSTTMGLIMEAFDLVDVSISTPMKRMVGAYFGIDPALFETEAVKASIEPITGLTFRRILQEVGKDWGRDCIDPDFWVKMQSLQIKKAIEAGRGGVVDPSMRFPNEAENWLANKGIVLEIVKPDRPRTPEDDHPGEQPLPRHLVSATVVNDGTIEELRRKAIETVERLAFVLNRTEGAVSKQAVALQGPARGGR